MSAAHIRLIEDRDFDAVVDVYLASRAAAMPWVAWAHDVASVRRWFTRVLLPSATTWVAERDGAVVGFICVEDATVSQLYVLPRHARGGIGRGLLDHAKESAAGGLTLRCFARNEPARAFYIDNGFVAVDQGDGSGNEENEPDVVFTWRAP